MRLVSYNILDGGLGRADPIAEILEANRPDVVTLLEADDQGVVERIAHRLKMDIVYAAGKQHAAAILSRFRIRESINYAPVDPALATSFVMAEIVLAPGQTLGVAAVHLRPHGTFEDERMRMAELSAIHGHLARWRERKLPHVLAGDFNANSPIQKIERSKVKPHTQRDLDANGGVLPRDVIGRLLADGYLDTLHAHAGDRAGEMASFTTNHPGQRVDYIFAKGIEPSQITSAWIEQDRLAKYASDHYPVGADIQL